MKTKVLIINDDPQISKKIQEVIAACEFPFECIVSSELPTDLQSYETQLFSVYLTGQGDVNDRLNGLPGRPFKAWYNDNILQVEKKTESSEQ